MAPKKKDDELSKAKEEIASGAKAVGKAAESLLRKPLRLPISDAHFGTSWEATKNAVNSLDDEFQRIDVEGDGGTDDILVQKLKQQFERGDIGVRVMQIGPEGRLTDVTGKVNPKDLRPEQFAGVDTEGPSLRSPRTREAAMRLLQDILPGLRISTETEAESTANSIRRMEAAIAESDKILEHWKR